MNRALRCLLFSAFAFVVGLVPLAQAQDGHTRALEAYRSASYEQARTLWLAELERSDAAAPDRAPATTPEPGSRGIRPGNSHRPCGGRN